MAEKHDLLTRCIHWFSALVVVGLFFSGWFMVDLDYYSPWYQTLPQWHQLFGLLLLFLWVIKLFRLKKSTQLAALSSHTRLEVVLAQIVKTLFYLLVFTITLSGYLFSTGGEEVVILFEYLKLPQLLTLSSQQIDTMAWLHEYLAYVLMALAGIHALAAIKHHTLDRDHTLKRML